MKKNELYFSYIEICFRPPAYAEVNGAEGEQQKVMCARML